jgi:energy-coupling factor transporter ATP-binding protein EcfA2
MPAAGQDNSLIVLYGDNGSGKTTVLNLLYRILSPEDNAGHRTALLKMPFQRVKVLLANGSAVAAWREKGAITGGYGFAVTDSNGRTVSAPVPSDANDASQIGPRDAASKAKWDVVIKALQHIGIRTHYLPDDRRPLNPSTDIRLKLLSQQVDLFSVADPTARDSLLQREPRSPLETAIDAAAAVFRHGALLAASIGEENTNKIYNEIVKSIARKGAQDDIVRNEDAVLRSLRDLDERSRVFSELGLVATFDTSDLIDSVREATPLQRRTMAKILGPYIESMRARLNALQGIQELLTNFLDGLNGFFWNKRIAFDQTNGLQIITSGGQLLRPSLLSSGEKQLLLLFCNTVTATQQAGVFIIDEPEISLNSKWQRQLIQALTKIVRGSQLQFVLATHSIELLTRFRSRVVHLEHVLK